jgi:hypothetical protein
MPSITAAGGAAPVVNISIRRESEQEPATTDSAISMKRSIEALKI